MKLAYVAGPYRSKFGKIGILINILRARKVAKKLWKMGYAVICPHSNSALFDGICDDERFLKGDLHILRRCDVIVMLPKWAKSDGAVSEWAYAMCNDIPVRYWRTDKMQLRREAV